MPIGVSKDIRCDGGLVCMACFVFPYTIVSMTFGVSLCFACCE